MRNKRTISRIFNLHHSCEKRDYIIKARCSFEGWYKVHAASKEDATRIVKENCGKRFGKIQGEIQVDVLDVLDWEFDTKTC